MDDRTGPTRARRPAGRAAGRANARSLNYGGDSRVAARAGRAVPTRDLSAAQLESEAERAERMAAGRRAAPRSAGRSGRKKSKGSRTAAGAAIVAGAAVVATVAFVLTNGNSSPPQTAGDPPPVVAPQSSAPTTSKSSEGNPAPAAAKTAKADRKPPPPTQTTAATSATPNTGLASPVFKRGQWIAVIDKYPTDAGMEADQLAKQLAGKLIAAGVPAKAMLLQGQYPGVADSSLQPESDAWVVYLGPVATSAAALDVCQAPKTQAVYPSLACPTYEPAVRPG
ncbi:hypothetical protein [Kribbella sp. NPDC023855]|uniref:hypothetical protein n=1 Tax=Kribbella sp. NPDC023855 TaxID=3154698 RepID=UPI0033E75BC6